jgi:hypothetical protein
MCIESYDMLCTWTCAKVGQARAKSGTAQVIEAPILMGTSVLPPQWYSIWTWNIHSTILS